MLAAPAEDLPERTPGTATRILDAAAHLLATRGYGGLRLQDVAKAAGVRPAAIYYYFASREELVEEVLWFGMSRLRRQLEESLATVPSDAPAVHRLLLAVEVHLRYQLEISDYTQASIRNAGQVAPDIRERQRQEFRAYRAMWQSLADAAATEAGLPAQPDRHLDLMLVIGALNWTAEWWRQERGDLEHLIAQARIFVRRGLLVAASTSPAAAPPLALKTSSPSTDTRSRILAATAATLRARGYAKAHLAEIAERADIQAPAIYHYFRSREALITTVLTEGQRTVRSHMQAALDQLPADADARTRTEALTDAYLRVELELSDFATAVTRTAGQAPPRVRKALAIEGQRLAELWAHTLDDAAARAELHEGIDPAIARMLALGALNWVPEWWHPNISVDRIAAGTRRVIVAGLFRPRA